MRYFWVGILLLAMSGIGCGNEREMESKIAKALSEYDAEKRDSVFSALKGADAFIQKFNLSADEIEMVGDWYTSLFIMNPKEDEKGIGIAVSFLPNRIFIAHGQITIKDEKGNYQGNIEFHKIGNWKAEKREVFIQPVYVISLKFYPDIKNYDSKEKLDVGYYPIWKISLYEQAAVQRAPFSYNKIPRGIRKACQINDKDFLRARRVVALSFDGGHNDLYQEDKVWHSFLMNPDLEDETYLYNLQEMFRIINERRYDFETNIGGLDFSKWE
jgi:hypothetical protein